MALDRLVPPILDTIVLVNDGSKPLRLHVRS